MSRTPKSDLATLVAAAKANSVVKLGRGRYRLDAPLVIDKALTIRGCGAGSIIVGQYGPAVIIVRKNARLRLEKLAVVREGKVPGHVIACRGGALEPRRWYLDQEHLSKERGQRDLPHRWRVTDPGVEPVHQQ